MDRVGLIPAAGRIAIKLVREVDAERDRISGSDRRLAGGLHRLASGAGFAETLGASGQSRGSRPDQDERQESRCCHVFTLLRR
ncbi:MAG: hypothetical protein JWP15_669 [Alphaproteobacteria bacterium]|nr:hypothetical protein [Alphaproteobacteria bacterium]